MNATTTTPPTFSSHIVALLNAKYRESTWDLYFTVLLRKKKHKLKRAWFEIILAMSNFSSHRVASHSIAQNETNGAEQYYAICLAYICFVFDAALFALAMWEA